MGKSSGKSGSSNNDLSDLAKEFAEESKPARMGYLEMMQDYLKGGTPAAQIPIIQSATEQSKKATSDTLRSIGDNLSSAGLGGSPYGQSVKAQAEMSGNQATAAIPSNIMSTILQQIPNFLTGQQSVAMQGLGTSAQAEASRYGTTKGFMGTMSPGQQAAGCCFIFLEAEDGYLDPVVRRFREERMTAENRRGYCMLAEVLVPRMKRSSIWKRAVRVFMTKPMISFGKWYYGQGRIGVVFLPLTAVWMWVFQELGASVESFVRGNGEEV